MADPLRIRLTWKPPFEPTVDEYNNNDWIYDVKWRQPTNDGRLMVRSPGLYIIVGIVDEVATEVYAGLADKVRDRFDGRTKVLREFRLSRPPQCKPNNPVEGYTVHVASVSPRKELGRAEKWLIRTLYNQQGDYILQNKRLIKPFKAPQGGLSISNAGSLPANIAATGYDYDAGEQI